MKPPSTISTTVSERASRFWAASPCRRMPGGRLRSVPALAGLGFAVPPGTRRPPTSCQSLPASLPVTRLMRTFPATSQASSIGSMQPSARSMPCLLPLLLSGSSACLQPWMRLSGMLCRGWRSPPRPPPSSAAGAWLSARPAEALDLASSQLALLNWFPATSQGRHPADVYVPQWGLYMHPQHSTLQSPAGSVETCLPPLPLTACGHVQPSRTASAFTNRPSPSVRPGGSNSCPLWSRLAVGGGRQP